jgi:periplasmic protein TonB
MSTDQRPFYTQPTTLVAAVLLLHAAGLYALQSGLLRRAVELVVPVAMLSQIIEPPQPVLEPVPQQPKPKPAQAPQPKAAPKPSTPPPAPQPLAVRDTTPAPAAPMGTTTPAPPAPPIDIAQAPAATPPAPPAPAAPPPAPAAPVVAKIELPSSDADYLNNPPPSYPPVSKRLGEVGKVVVRVFIGSDGAAQKGEVRSSSGFERLDAAALAAALKWRYVPGKRGGVADAMWVNVPINFTLN